MATVVIDLVPGVKRAFVNISSKCSPIPGGSPAVHKLSYKKYFTGFLNNQRHEIISPPIHFHFAFIYGNGHGGELMAETRENEGTEFIIELPV